MQKKLSHVVLIMELASISLMHAARLHKNTQKEVAKILPVQVQRRTVTARLFMVQQRP